MSKFTKAALFYNQNAGQSDTVNQIGLIESHFIRHKIPLTIIKLPKPYSELQTIISQAIADDVNLFIAAGGDGTVSLVGSQLVGTGKALGILPIGTGNMLAKELNIPRNLQGALDSVTAQDSNLIQLDTMKLADRNYILNLSVGVSPKVMNDTPDDEKKRLGFFAYFIHLFEQLLGLKLEKFHLDYDNHQETVVASEIMITNGRLMSIERFEWAEDISINDGILDIFTIRAANMVDFMSFIFSAITNQNYKNPIIKSMRFNEYCRIETKTPLLVQADGDPIGETPVEIRIEPQSLNIIVPKADIVSPKQERKTIRKDWSNG
jgi:diacylglycerol kinase (ATP)